MPLRRLTGQWAEPYPTISDYLGGLGITPYKKYKDLDISFQALLSASHYLGNLSKKVKSLNNQKAVHTIYEPDFLLD
jgi:hypothetical protein